MYLSLQIWYLTDIQKLKYLLSVSYICPAADCDHLVKFRATSQAAVTLIMSVAVGRTFISADVS